MSSPFISDSSASLRATGIGRYIGATFLMVWLAGWTIGEAVALGVLIMVIRSAVGSAAGLSWPIPGGEWIAGGATAFAFLFLLVWLALWTFAGYAAIRELLRKLAGEDRISVQPAGVELVRRAGPFRRIRTFDRSQIRRVRIRLHDKGVVLDTVSGPELMTTFGTAAERQAVLEWLRRRLSLPDEGTGVDPAAAPPGWRMTVEAGTTRLSRTDLQAWRTGALLAWVIAGLTGVIWFGSMQTGRAFGSLVALALALLLVTVAAWITWSRREWLVRYGHLTSHRRFGTRAWDRSFAGARLEVVQSTDSDNDDLYELKVFDEQGARTIANEVNDEAGIVDLAVWLSARTGFSLTMPRGMRPRRATPVTEEEMG